MYLDRRQLKVIKKFASHPDGLGYVLSYSNNTFANWFRDNWKVDIEDQKYAKNGTSKGDRLLTFCLLSEPEMVMLVLSKLYQESQDLKVQRSEVITLQDVRQFELLLNEILPSSKDPESRPADAQLSKKKILNNIQVNRQGLVLLTSATIESLEEFRELVRSDNMLSVKQPELREKYLTLLEAIQSNMEELLSLVPGDNGKVSSVQGDQIFSWTQRYVDAALPKLEEYISPEALGRTSAPAGLILFCGGIGALLTGLSPLGFGAGSVFGKLIVGEMKSGKAADELQQHFSEDK